MIIVREVFSKILEINIHRLEQRFMERNLNNLEDFHPKVLTTWILVRGGFRGGMHAVLGDFVDTARGRLLVDAVDVVERTAPFSDGVTFFDGLGDVGFGE